MPIRKDKDSNWISTSKLYRCKDCGDDYYTSYKDNRDRCMWCAIEKEEAFKTLGDCT